MILFLIVIKVEKLALWLLITCLKFEETYQ